MNSNTIPTNGNFITRLHPLVAVAAASVIVVSLLGAAALAGLLPNSRADVPTALTASEQAQINQSSSATTPQKHQNHATTAPQSTKQVASNSNVPVQTTAQQAPAQPAAAKQNSAVGIGIGAVVGGLLGNQVGSGDGKTLATVAGAVGGAYVGNEIAKKNQ